MIIRISIYESDYTPITIYRSPAKAEGTEEEVWAVFQRVRDQIEERDGLQKKRKKKL
ncbi:arsenate reductase [Desmospora sp. 8437]|uniref:Uncharacterized protein n=1 Tax=Kroppenstedtia guangzhouensis TaxID=1274356 RepID=A0ABQ1H4D8_9BACL|nr:arsenate reductase [Desmospora sp. 8437]GGA57352.1 hypothetical protein GCM10007416_33220 [Kroppenstedtia guangzhouensis]